MRRILVFAVAISLILTLGAMVLLKIRATMPPVVDFADGTRLEFLGSTAGSEPFTTERPWHKLLRRHLPGRWLGFLPPASTGTCSSGSNSVTFFFRQTGGTPGTHPWQHYTGRDSDGFLYPMDGGSCRFGSGTAQTLGLSLRSYPRRQAEFDFDFFDSRGKTVGSLRLPNSVSGPFPAWTPNRLPISITNGPVTLTLESLQMRTNHTWQWLQPKWHVETADLRWQHSKAGYATVTDATGNEGSFSSFKESAWCLTTQVHRQRWEDFDPAEKLILTNLTLPEPGQFLPLDASARISGVDVVVAALCSAGTFSITNHPTNGETRGMNPSRGGGTSSSVYGDGTTEENWGMTQPFLFIEVKGMRGRDELRFRAFDELNQEVKLEASGYHGRQGSSQARVYTPAFTTLTNGNITRLECVVSRPFEFDFLISPTEVKLGK